MLSSYSHGKLAAPTKSYTNTALSAASAAAIYFSGAATGLYLTFNIWLCTVGPVDKTARFSANRVFRGSTRAGGAGPGKE